MIKQLLVVASLVGCGQLQPDNSIYRTPSTGHQLEVKEPLKKIVDEFRGVCKEKNVAKCIKNWDRLQSIEAVPDEVINPNEEDKKNPKAGVCFMWTNASGEIVSSKIIVHERYLTDEAVLRGVIYHELGHCTLELDHTAPSWVDLHMMNPWVYDDEIYDNHWDSLVKDEFNSSLKLVDSETELNDVVRN